MKRMDDSQNAFEFLERLSRQNASQEPTFSSLMDYIEAKARRQGIPLNGQFELTPLCNFDCKMCYAHLTVEQLHGRKPLTAAQWKPLMHEAWEAGMMNVNLTGGECLIYPGFEEIYRYLMELGCQLTVLTNAEFLDEKWIRFFKAYPPRLIQISLYGGDEDTYERVTGHRKFSVVYENIRRAVAAELPVSIAITPSRYFGEGIFDTLRAASALGVHYAISDRLTDPKEETGRSGQNHDLGVEDYARIYRFRNELNGVNNAEIAPEKLPPPGGPHREWRGCGLTCKDGISAFTVEWDGRLYACGSIRDIWARPLEEGFLAAWNSVHERALAWPPIPACIECPYRAVCTNCAAEKVKFAAPGKQPLPLCERTRYLVQRGARRISACE